MIYCRSIIILVWIAMTSADEISMSIPHRPFMDYQNRKAAVNSGSSVARGRALVPIRCSHVDSYVQQKGQPGHQSIRPQSAAKEVGRFTLAPAVKWAVQYGHVRSAYPVASVASHFCFTLPPTHLFRATCSASLVQIPACGPNCDLESLTSKIRLSEGRWVRDTLFSRLKGRWYRITMSSTDRDTLPEQ